MSVTGNDESGQYAILQYMNITRPIDTEGKKLDVFAYRGELMIK